MSNLYEIIPVMKDALVGAASIVGAYVALNGLSSWRRKERRKETLLLAENLFHQSNKLKNAIREIRTQHYYNDFARQLKEKKASNHAKVIGTSIELADYYESKIDNITEIRTSLDFQKIKTEIVWDQSVSNSIDSITNHLFALIFDIQKIVACIRKGRHDYLFSEDIRFNHSIVFRHEDGSDNFSSTIDKEFELIAAILELEMRRVI